MTVRDMIKHLEALEDQDAPIYLCKNWYTLEHIERMRPELHQGEKIYIVESK